MYFLNVFLSLVMCICNYTISASELQTTEMEEMISIDCNAEPIKLCIKTVTKDFDLFKKRNFITTISSIKNLFINKANDGTCESLKNLNTLKYEVTSHGSELCENNCCNKNKTNVNNYNEKIPIVISKLLTYSSFNVHVEAICKNVGECFWEEQKKIFECKCKQNYQILVTKQLNSYLNYFKENKVSKNFGYFDSYQIFAGYMFLLKCQPKTASEYLEWWVKQLQNFPVKNRPSTFPDLHNLHQTNAETTTPLYLYDRHNHGKHQTTNNYFCLINDGDASSKSSNCFCCSNGSSSNCCSCGDGDNGERSSLNCCSYCDNDNGEESLLACCCCCCLSLLDPDCISSCLG